MRFPVTSASLNAQEAKPAIVQAAKRNCAWYKNEIRRLAVLLTQDSDAYAKTVKEFKDGETWKQEYKTWGHACREVLDISPQRAHQLTAKLTEVYSDSMSTDLSTPLDNTSHKVKSVSLKVVEPSSPVEEPKEEEPEKPAVHSTDEAKQPEPKAHTNGHVVKAENGRPKQSLAAWRELEESLIGRAINRADELNRLCPNTQMHARLVASLKASLTILEQWKQSVQ